MSAKFLRRTFGLVCLLGAMGMLIAGELGWPPGLSAVGVLGYWLTCFLLTIAAFVTALWDARIVRRDALAERRELFRRTFGGLGLDEVASGEHESPSEARPKPQPEENSR